MASYLATVQINDYKVVTSTSASGIRIRNYFLQDTPVEVQSGFDKTGAMLDYMSDLIAPYPYDTYGVVLINETASWALETQTLSTFGMDGANRETTVFHELVHSWFGDSVSPATWQDTWLNEGFAMYFEALWLDHTGKRSVDDTMDEVYDMVVSQKMTPPAKPVKETIFGGSVYYRGAYALHALRKVVGDDLFFGILRTYYAQYQGSSASTADFEAIVAAKGGKDAEKVLHDWLYADKVPGR